MNDLPSSRFQMRASYDRRRSGGIVLRVVGNTRRHSWTILTITTENEVDGLGREGALELVQRVLAEPRRSFAHVREEVCSHPTLTIPGNTQRKTCRRIVRRWRVVIDGRVDLEDRPVYPAV